MTTTVRQDRLTEFTQWVAQHIRGDEKGRLRSSSTGCFKVSDSQAFWKLAASHRTLELPGANPLKDAHAALDDAVLADYGFSCHDDLLAQLLDLNFAVANRIREGKAVTSPGIPPDYRNRKSLITSDCIRREH